MAAAPASGTPTTAAPHHQKRRSDDLLRPLLRACLDFDNAGEGHRNPEVQGKRIRDQLRAGTHSTYGLFSSIT